MTRDVVTWVKKKIIVELWKFTSKNIYLNLTNSRSLNFRTWVK